jgi:hypothetical protein
MLYFTINMHVASKRNSLLILDWNVCRLNNISVVLFECKIIFC